MNGWWIIILGLILVGVGGFLGFYGAQLNNRSDNDAASAALNTKIEEVLTKIAAAQSAVPSPNSTAPDTSASTNPPAQAAARELRDISQDFTEWASTFMHNRSTKTLELDRLKATAKNEERRISNKCRPIFQYAIETLRGSIAAFNSTARTSYNAQLKDLPDNLYEVDNDRFDIGTIEFTPTIIWTINVVVFRPPRDASPPVFYILIPHAKPGLPSDNFRIEVRESTLLFQAGGGGVAGIASVDATPGISSYQPALRGSLQRLLEAQITVLSSDR